jgi:hypothetical protein
VEIRGSVGLQYDSNVVLAPSDDTVASEIQVSEREDGVVNLALGATARVVRSRYFELRLDYDFSQSLHFELDELDLQGHRPRVSVSFDTTPVRWGVVSGYDYFRTNDGGFLQQPAVTPWLSVSAGRLGQTELHYQYRLEEFLSPPLRDERDGDHHAAGVRQIVPLGDSGRYVVGGYRFERRDARQAVGAAFAYDAHEVQAGTGFDLPASVGVDVLYRYRYEDYDPTSGGRRDDDHRIDVAVARQLNHLLTLKVEYLGRFNSSNDEIFDYDRHIGVMSVEFSY